MREDDYYNRRSSEPEKHRPDEGEVAAKVFALFERKRNLHQIVMELNVHPKVVRDLYREYRKADLTKDARLEDELKTREIEDKKHRKRELNFDKSLSYYRDLAKGFFKGDI